MSGSARMLTPPARAFTAASGLPEPPSDGQKFAYIKRHVRLLQIFTVCSFACIAYSTTRFALIDDELSVMIAFLFVSGLALAISLRMDVFARDFDDAEHRRLVDAAWKPRRRGFACPSVDVFLPICGEDEQVVLNTWKHVRALDYPKLTVYCLDDSADGRMRQIAEEYGFKYLRRENRGWLKKAGNLQNGYRNSRGEFVVILDADFAPRRDFLRETLPYFEAEPGLGILQTPQYFHTTSQQSWLERGAGAVQEYFYRVAQVARDSSNASICVGTCAVYRRAALDSNGGTTLVEHSEDVHTGFDLRRHGWRLRYVPVNLAAGLCPDNLASFFRQQYRWCMGSMSLCVSKKFWSTRMPVATRICYISGFLYYILTALAVFAAPVIPLTLTIFFPARIRLENYIVLLPSFMWIYVVMPMWHRSRFRLETLSVKLTYGWAHAFALFDIVRGKPMGWTPTGARARDHRVLWFRVGAAVWGGGTAVLLIASCLWQVLGRGYPVERLVPMLIFSCIYLRTNARIVLYGAGRRSHRRLTHRRTRRVPRRRRYISPSALSLLRPLLRYSGSRDAYVLRAIGNRHGPVLRHY